MVITKEKAPRLEDVVVTSPFQVAHAGVTYGPGSLVSVSVEIAREWIRCGWVTPA
jgi:hypothetical protein